MTRLWIAVLSIPLLAVAISRSAVAQEITFTIKGSAWTDTGVDLATGDSVQISATAVPSPSAEQGKNPACVPEGRGTPGEPAILPLATAPQGALIARLHAQGGAPLLVGKEKELHIQEPSHLFLAMNLAGAMGCDGSLAVTVHKNSSGSTSVSPAKQLAGTGNQPAAPSSGAATQGNSGAPSSTPSDAKAQSHGEQLKSQLSTAAQIFMQGQFGSGKSENAGGNAVSGTATTEANSASPLKISAAPLDADLRHHIDALPRRVNDNFQHLGDMVNFVIIGSQKDVQTALNAANWHLADTNNRNAVVTAALETYDKKDYLAMPMSVLYLFGRGQDFGYEQAEPIAMVASRHHFRIWKAPFTWQGHEVWVGAGTHDIGFAKDQRNGSVTHKIDPAVDGERENIGTSLQKSGKTKSMSYYLPPNPVQEAKNATGDGYHSDGRMLVIFLQ